MLWQEAESKHNLGIMHLQTTLERHVCDSQFNGLLSGKIV